MPAIENNRCVDCASGHQRDNELQVLRQHLQRQPLINCNNITNRHGEGNLIANNRLERCKGIVVQDARTVVTGNTLIGSREGPGIQIMAGTAAWNAQVQGDHPQAAYTVVRSNNGGLMIGRKYSGYNFPALGTRVESHVGKITLKFQQGTVMQPPPPVLPPAPRRPSGREVPRGEVLLRRRIAVRARRRGSSARRSSRSPWPRRAPAR